MGDRSLGGGRSASVSTEAVVLCERMTLGDCARTGMVWFSVFVAILVSVWDSGDGHDAVGRVVAAVGRRTDLRWGCWWAIAGICATYCRRALRYWSRVEYRPLRGAWVEVGFFARGLSALVAIVPGGFMIVTATNVGLSLSCLPGWSGAARSGWGCLDLCFWSLAPSRGWSTTISVGSMSP